MTSQGGPAGTEKVAVLPMRFPGPALR